MIAIAEQLDRRHKMMPAAQAACVTRLVRGLLEVVETTPAGSPHDEAGIAEHRAHIQGCLAAAKALDWSDFERPDQGISENREDDDALPL